ncbi:hypothetical protein KAR91_48025 [Candidatus Pacearchaeota archaeon]|nr:hypothetical protein [Candidatus Pacearchaeota archaeon]
MSRFFVMLDTHVGFGSYKEAEEKIKRLTKGAYIIVEECVLKNNMGAPDCGYPELINNSIDEEGTHS